MDQILASKTTYSPKAKQNLYPHKIGGDSATPFSPDGEELKVNVETTKQIKIANMDKTRGVESVLSRIN